MKCPVCATSKTKLITQLPFNIGSGNKMMSDIYLCKRCDLYWRNFDTDIIFANHFEESSYTQLEKEDSLLSARRCFFEQILDIVAKNGGGSTLLDFGCSYGHLMDIATEQGYVCTGVEIVDYLRKKLETRYIIYEDIHEVANNSMDIVTCIDSLYYVSNPVEVMQKISKILKDGGLCIIRIANRKPMINLMRLLKKEISNKIFGDQLCVLNDKAIKLIAKKSGMTIDKIIYKENKPQKQELWLRFSYNVMPYICKITGLKFSPGIIYVLKK